MRAATVEQVVNEGNIVDLGNRHFEVLHLHGHSPGSIGVREVGTGTLFSGDAVYDGLLLDEWRKEDGGISIDQPTADRAGHRIFRKRDDASASHDHVWPRQGHQGRR